MRTVTRNLVRQGHRRAEGRRRSEEEAAREEALPSTEELVERVSVQREVVDRVLELDEVHRRTILLRYFEQLSPDEIAARTGTPLPTVKTRLRRALARLRENLDRRHGGDGHAWLAALAPLFPKTGGLSAAAPPTGALLVSTKTALTLTAAAAVAIVGGLWILLPRGESPEPTASGTGDDGGLLAPALPDPAESPAITPDERVPLGSKALATDTLEDREGAAQEPNRRLTIQVVDEQGSPVAGVPVGVRWQEERRDGIHGTAETQAPMGLAVIENLDVVLPVDLDRGERAFATLVVPLREQVERSIDHHNVPKDPVRLVLPPTGVVTALVEDEDGNAASDRWVHLTAVERDPSRVDVWQRISGSRRMSSEGRAVFSHVGLGLELLAGSDHPQSSWRTEAVIAGPRKAGEEVTVVLVFERRRTRSFSGRLVTPQGEPLARRLVYPVFEFAGSETRGAAERSWFVTDADGRFRTEAFVPSPEARMSRIRFTTGEPQRTTCKAEVSIVDTGSGEEVPLGDIVVNPESLIVSGCVVDEDGDPIPWASVRVRHKVDRWGNPYAPEDGDDFQWWILNDLQAQGDQKGRFEARGSVDPGVLALVISKRGYLDSDLVPFSPGDREVRIVLRSEGVVTGRVLLDEGIPPSWIFVEVEAHEGAPQVWWSGSDTFTPRARLAEDGSFHVPNLLPGPSAVHVRPWRDAEPLVTIGDVMIECGGTNRDPRLQEIDLRGLLRHIEIEAVGSSGAVPVEGHMAILDAPVEDETMPHIALEQGRASFVTRMPSVDLVVHAIGYRPARLESVSDDTKVVLRPGIPVRVRLPSSIELPDPPHVLRAQLQHESQYRRPASSRRIHTQDGEAGDWWQNWILYRAKTFGESRSVELRLPTEGAYQIFWFLDPEDDRSLGSLPTPEHQTEVEVEDSDAELVLDWGPDLAEYSARLDALREGR